MGRTPRRTLPILVALALVVFVTPVAAVDEPDAPATALRVTLDRALGEHAILLSEVIRSGIAGAPDFEAAAGTLEENSTDVIGAIEGIYGPDAGAAFGEQWNNHVGYIVDYARALADGDADAQQLATEQLAQYVSDFSGFLAEALPALPPDAIEGLIGEHVQQLEHVASFGMADFVGAYGAIRETYAHMFDVGDGLTVGIVSLFPERFTGREQAFSPATDLRITLDRLIGEHSYLGAVSLRAILRGAMTGEAATEALVANSDELRDTIGQIYGADAGEAFVRLWDEHDAALLDYVSARRDADETAAATALDSLATQRTTFTAYLAEVNPTLSVDAFDTLVADHTDSLVRQADAYADADYEVAHGLARDAYTLSGELSASLAAAIVDQFPQRFPDAATSSASPPVGLVGAGLLLLGAAALLARRRRSTPLARLDA